MRGTILEMRTHQPRRAVAVLREHLAGTSVGLFGDRVHVVSHEPDRTSAEAETALRQAGLDVVEIRPIEPSLEDVFISVLAEKVK
jgi:ABC-2 type transport system ATP-binding protein